MPPPFVFRDDENVFRPLCCLSVNVFFRFADFRKNKSFFYLNLISPSARYFKCYLEKFFGWIRSRLNSNFVKFSVEMSYFIYQSMSIIEIELSRMIYIYCQFWSKIDWIMGIIIVAILEVLRTISRVKRVFAGKDLHIHHIEKIRLA